MTNHIRNSYDLVRVTRTSEGVRLDLAEYGPVTIHTRDSDTYQQVRAMSRLEACTVTLSALQGGRINAWITSASWSYTLSDDAPAWA